MGNEKLTELAIEKGIILKEWPDNMYFLYEVKRRLREDYEIHIAVLPFEGGKYDYQLWSTRLKGDEMDSKLDDNYESALERGLLKGLSLI